MGCFTIEILGPQQAEDLKGGWLDTVAKGIATEVSNGSLSRGVLVHALPENF